jgi:hypothetical protein
MTADHSSYEELASARRDSPDYREGYAEAQRAYLIGQAVRERRLEAGGVIPTFPLLERISAALDADLIVQIAPHAA